MLGLIAWIVVTIGLAAVTTWGVVKISPGDKDEKPAGQTPAS